MQRVTRNTSLMKFVKQLDGDAEIRSFVVIGAAAGIAVAFRAPMGGVLFVLEEAISFFDAKLIFRTYFVCAVSYYILLLIYEGHYLRADNFAEYNSKIVCEVGYYAEDLIMFVILGIIGGASGSLWNWLIMRMAAFRRTHMRTGLRRLLDALAVCFVTSLFVAFVPINFGCSSAANLITHLPSDTCVSFSSEI